MNIIQIEEGNKLIKSYIDEYFKTGKPVNISRVSFGTDQIDPPYYYDNNIPYTDIVYNMARYTGIFPSTRESLDYYSQRYIDGIKSSDVMVYWKSNVIQQQDHLFQKYIPNVSLIENRSIEPFYFSDPWSSSLKHKTVLVIHPFAETIKSQYSHRELLFANKDILPNLI